MYDTIEELIQKVKKTEHGFLNILKEAENFKNNHSVKDCLIISKKLFSAEVYQARSLATFILGFIAYDSKEALNFLKTRVSEDNDWRVQEILAKSFDRYCSNIGYKNALPTIKEWLSDKNPNVKRAVTEGLRIWTGRNYFKDNPGVAIKLLSRLKDDDSKYLRKSVGNALRDISKKHKELIKSEIETWNTLNKRIGQTYKLASKFINKK
ncbi:HEAT repeat domain-containing protein [bacterium]|nr:HEAT repeat domain-containing protein [bacterium]